LTTTADYINRVFDVLAFRGATQKGEVLLEQSLFDGYDGGEICTGVQKLAQRWALEFLTVRGSMPFHLSERGSEFLTWVRQGRLRTEYDVQAYFNFARQQVRTNLLNEETDDMHPEDRLGGAVLLQVTVFQDGLQLSVAISSLAGTEREIILPVPYLPINTSI